MDPIVFLAFTAAYLALLMWGITLAVRNRWWTAANLPLLVVAGLVYDNAVLATGAHIGPGELLEGLNLGRYWIHALVTPLLVVFSWCALDRAGVVWARTRWALVLAAVAAVALMALELTHVVGIEMEAEREYGVLSYSAVTAGGPPLMVLLVSVALLVAGFFVWRRQKWPWLLVGTLLMVVGSAVPIPVNSSAATNAFELILLASIIATKHFQDRTAPGPKLRG